MFLAHPVWLLRCHRSSLVVVVSGCGVADRRRFTVTTSGYLLSAPRQNLWPIQFHRQAGCLQTWHLRYLTQRRPWTLQTRLSCIRRRCCTSSFRSGRARGVKPCFRFTTPKGFAGSSPVSGLRHQEEDRTWSSRIRSGPAKPVCSPSEACLFQSWVKNAVLPFSVQLSSIRAGSSCVWGVGVTSSSISAPSNSLPRFRTL